MECCRILDQIAKPKISGSKSIQEIQNLLHKECPHAQIELLDHTYTFYPVKELIRFFGEIGLNKIQYRSEAFDCDDFVKSALGLETLWLRSARLPNTTTAIGSVVGDLRLNSSQQCPHTMLIFIDPSLKIYLVEPQNNRIYPLSNLKPGSRITRITM